MIPSPSPTNSLQQIMTLTPPASLSWCVFAYAIPVDADDTLKAVVFMLGAFTTQELATAHAKSIIEKTGHSKIVVAKYGMPVQLSNTIDQAVVTAVPVDLNNKLIQLEQEDYIKQKEFFEQKQKIEQELLLEMDHEENVHDIEHYKYNMYLTLKHYDMYEQLRTKSNDMFQLYKKRREHVLSHFKSHPMHDAQFLDFLKQKLEPRGEMPLFEWIKQKYEQHRGMILNIKLNTTTDASLV